MSVATAIRSVRVGAILRYAVEPAPACRRYGRQLGHHRGHPDGSRRRWTRDGAGLDGYRRSAYSNDCDRAVAANAATAGTTVIEP